MKFSGGNQIGVSFAPKTRVHGFVYVSVWCREGTGSKKALAMCDWFSDALAYKSQGGVQLQAAEPVGGNSPVGWYVEGIKLYWYANNP